MDKCNKKSTLQQLQALVDYMEQNSDFARGTPVFGGSKISTEELWKDICTKLNAIGPPIRTIVEWKKTWADLKSRTKKKIAGNKKSLLETGGGLYRANPLSELEVVIDRTLFLSKAAVPSGNVFGYATENVTEIESVDNYFQALVETPPRVTKVVAVVTPTRQQQQLSQQLHSSHQPQQQHQDNCNSYQLYYQQQPQQKQRTLHTHSYELPQPSTQTKNTQQTLSSPHPHIRQPKQTHSYKLPHTSTQTKTTQQTLSSPHPHIRQPQQTHSYELPHTSTQTKTTQQTLSSPHPHIRQSQPQQTQKRQYHQANDEDAPASSSKKKEEDCR